MYTPHRTDPDFIAVAELAACIGRPQSYIYGCIKYGPVLPPLQPHPVHGHKGWPRQDLLAHFASEPEKLKSFVRRVLQASMPEQQVMADRITALLNGEPVPPAPRPPSAANSARLAGIIRDLAANARRLADELQRTR